MSEPKQVEALHRICLSCARFVYPRTISEEYARRVARLLLGTAAQESKFIDRRQMGFGWDHIGGAWGLWQVQYNSTRESISRLETRPLVRAATHRWLTGGSPAELSFLTDAEAYEPLWLMQAVGTFDRLGCLFARLHYLRKPEPVPLSVPEMADYWKEYYNTEKGVGKPCDFVESWDRMIGPRDFGK